MRGLAIFFFILATILLFGLIGFIVYDIYINYIYERIIGSYFDNAKDCITPDCILEQLNLGKQAIINEGLTETLYGAIWFKKPNNCMKFQYTHLDSIIERANAVAIWVKQTQESGQVETMKDVYNEKMDNLRNYIHAEGYRSDWIAKDTWYIKNHIVLYFNWIIIFILIILPVILYTIGGVLWNEFL